MRKLVLATILAGTALFGGMTANAAEIHADRAFPDSHEIAVARDAVPYALKSGPKLDAPKIGKRDDDRRGPGGKNDKGPGGKDGKGDKKGPGGKDGKGEHRYGPRNPSETSGAKNGPGGKIDNKGPGGKGGKSEHRYGPRNPSETSGAKNGPGGNRDKGPGVKNDNKGPGGKNDNKGPGVKNDNKGPGGKNDKKGPGGKNDNKGPGGKGGPGNGQPPKALGAFTFLNHESGEIVLPQDVSFGLFGHSHRYDPPPPPPPGDRHDPPPPPPEDRGPRIDGRYGPHFPSPTSGAKYGPREYNE